MGVDPSRIVNHFLRTLSMKRNPPAVDESNVGRQFHGLAQLVSGHDHGSAAGKGIPNHGLQHGNSAIVQER